MKLYYVTNARMPTEKAHGIQTAKMCEAFIEEGVDVTLLAPCRKRSSKDVQGFYQLRVHVPIIFLPTIDWYTLGVVGYRISSYLFALSTVLFLLYKKCTGEEFIIYTIDLDDFSSSLLPLVGKKLYTEMHMGKEASFSQRFLFKYLSGVIPINSHIKKELQQRFPESMAWYVVEPNAVDAQQFFSCEKDVARKRLNIGNEEHIALYAGRFFEWKGLETLYEAASLLPEVAWYLVGGTAEEFIAVTGLTPLPPNMIFKGSQPHQDMPYWIAAADALIVLGTGRDTQSYQYTSPMKLFEYLLSKRPIIASKTPALQDIVSEAEVHFYKPDDAISLAASVSQALSIAGAPLIERAYSKGLHYSWKRRAGAILRAITASCATF